MKNKFILIVGIILLTGCSTNHKLTRYFKTIQNPDQISNNDLVEVSVLSVNKPRKTTEATLLKLTDRGQEKFIEVLSKYAANNNELLEALGKSIGGTKKSPYYSDETLINRRIVFSAMLVDKANGIPGDRITKLDCKIKCLSNGEFKSWNLFSTKYGDVNLGDISLTQDASGTLSIKATSAENSSDPVERGGSLTRSNALTEAYSLNQRYIELTGIMTPEEARFYQESPQGRNLAGNSFIDIEFDLDNVSMESVVVIQHLKKKDGTWNPQDKVKVIEKLIGYPDESDVRGDLICDYVVRIPGDEKSRRTPIEGDDNAMYKKGRVKQSNVVLIPHEVLSKNLRVIAKSGTPHVLQIEYPTGEKPALLFQTHEEAIELLSWLIGSTQTRNMKMSNMPLILNGNPLNKTDVPGLLIDLL